MADLLGSNRYIDASSLPFEPVDPRHFEDLVVEVARGLITEGCVEGNWGDERGTADALLALSEILHQDSFCKLRSSAIDFLISRAVRDGDSSSWGEEVWDTSIVLIALCRAEQPDRHIIACGARWLLDLYKRGENNWYSEPWETLWALIALHHVFMVVPNLGSAFNPAPVLHWLLKLFDPARGLLINYHYTAQFVIALSRWIEHPSVVADDQGLAESLQNARISATQHFALSLSPVQAEPLWTPDIWANALIIWAMADSGAVTVDRIWLSHVLEWFRRSLTSAAATEDRAFSILALSRLAREVDRQTSLKIPESLLALERRLPDPTLRILVEYVQSLDLDRRGEALRAKLSPRITEIPDFQYCPPPLTTQAHKGYYTFNVSQTLINVTGILLLTVLLTVLTITAGDWFGAKAAAWLTAIPIGLGTLATLAQILDIRIPEWLKTRRK